MIDSIVSHMFASGGSLEIVINVHPSFEKLRSIGFANTTRTL